MSIVNRLFALLVSDWFVIRYAQAIVALLLFFVFVTSIWISGVALHDPDTCWLLALGRYMYEHNAIPQFDPYSFTHTMKPFVMYQWLSELCLYAAYKIYRLEGVLTLTTILLVNSFISIPLSICLNVRAPRLWSIATVILGALAASWHFLARPEIFSYLFLGIWLKAIINLQEDAIRKTDDFSYETKSHQVAFMRLLNWKTIIYMSMLMIWWCNFHSGFMIGIVILSLYVVSISLGKLIFRHCSNFAIYNSVAALILSIVSTLFNPKGIGLWHYLPQLFFSAINKRIVELEPLHMKDFFQSIFFYPFFLLSITALICMLFFWQFIFRQIHKKPIGHAIKNIYVIATVYGIYNSNLILLSVISGLLCRRLIPFDAIALTITATSLWILFSEIRNNDTLRNQLLDNPKCYPTNGWIGTPLVHFFQHLELSLKRFFHPRGIWWHSTITALVLLGCYLTNNRIAIPTLPQASKTFQPPFLAINYLKKNLPPGRVFSHPQYADMMIWYCKPVPPIFIDTRFDMYGQPIISDYEAISSCSKNWTQTFNKYDFSWAFVPCNTPLVRYLTQEMNWHELYRDRQSVILQKPFVSVKTNTG